MKKLLILPLLLLITSCSSIEMTQEQKLNKIKECKELWVNYYVYEDKVQCWTYIENKVMDCIKEYTNSLDEKYNNPDTVSNLTEDNYSQVVKTCNEIFGNK